MYDSLKGFVYHRHLRSAGRGMLLTLVGILACAALIRALVGLLEAAALLLIAVAVTMTISPHGLRAYRRFARREIPALLDTVTTKVAAIMGQFAPATQAAQAATAQANQKPQTAQAEYANIAAPQAAQNQADSRAGSSPPKSARA